MKLSSFSFFIFVVLILISCEKEKCNKDGICFELIYPVSYNMPDGTVITGNNKEEIWAPIKIWYEANPDSEEKPTLQYPVDLIFDEGTEKTIESEEEMKWAKKGCKGKKDKDKEYESCLDLVFPASFDMPDNSVLTANDEKDMWTAIKAWYEVNPNAEEKPALQYPVDVVFEDGNIATINNKEEMIIAKKNCTIGEGVE
ncbi:MAG: hypothetical protein ACI94Y_004420 [Maribacter sp.]|jgi:hypothetical protein